MDNQFCIKGKTVIITGGASGLGLQMVHLFVNSSANVVCADKRAGPASLAKQPNYLFVPTDLTRFDNIENLFERCQKQWGAPDIVINNAGLALMEKAGKITSDQFDQVINVNLKAAFQIMQAAAKAMRDAKKTGSIINISSYLANQPMTGTSVYGAAKTALEHQSRNLALEWGKYGIRVNVIAPGWFPTPLSENVLNGPAGEIFRSRNPLRRLGQNGDLDGALLLLASDAGRYITGTTIPVDGGQSLSG